VEVAVDTERGQRGEDSGAVQKQKQRQKEKETNTKRKNVNVNVNVNWFTVYRTAELYKNKRQKQKEKT